MRRVSAALIGSAVFLSLIFQAAAQSSANPSGLPWQSGTTKPINEFATWRGRRLDVRTMFFGKLTWEHIRASANARPLPGMKIAIGMGMLPETHRGQLAQCGAGAFDREITAIRDNMLRTGFRGSLIRLGWEGNRLGSFPWAAIGDGSSWVACWRRWNGILNPPEAPDNFLMVWNMGNQGSFPFPIDRLYPGGDSVDIIASQFYDRCPPITTAAAWTQRMTVRDQWGNPGSPQQWLNYAKSKGKPYALPEWGIGGTTSVCPRPGFDNPYFIRRMHEFLRVNAADISFESYFNHPEGNGSHELYPMHRNPRAAAEYRRLW